MPRKSKEEKYFEAHKQTIYECLNDYSDSNRFFEEDKLFVVLLLAGYSAAAAYRIAYPSKATMQSSAVLASRRIREPQIQMLLNRVMDSADSGLLYVSQKGFKGKRRWPSWMGKRVKNIDTSPI
ncbi:hypothetical protein [Bacteroides acidifaciens]|jgi:hypothetical protein|uniref:hypothetical protein n=1 Tax=Bacteroides acidifaciens TaxID=85831 RepID=UPI003014C458